MGSYKKIENLEFKEELKKLFPIEELIFGELVFGGIIPILFVRFNSLDALKTHWKDFNSHIATEYITLIKDEYSRWNFYIFYFSDVEVPKSVKYEIENNKFSSRKIVIKNCEAISETEIENVISEHITNTNIQINVENKQVSTFKKNSSLAKIVDKLSLSKKNEEDLQNALNLIENSYEDEI
jgi:hypothetical protein